MTVKELVQELLKHKLTKDVVFQVEIEIFNEIIGIGADEIEITENKSQLVITLHDPDIE